MSKLTAPTRDHFAARAMKVSCIASIFVMLVGALSLTGWLLDIDGLKSIYGNITMKANAALSLLLAGASLWLLDVGAKNFLARRVGQVCGVTIALIGALTLSEQYSLIKKIRKLEPEQGGILLP